MPVRHYSSYLDGSWLAAASYGASDRNIPPTDYYLEYAAKGAGFLDKVIEQPWRPMVDTRILRLESSYRCVLGQLFGTYQDGTFKLQLDRDETIRLGFSVERDQYHTEAAWDRLTEAWRLTLAGV